jgi:hypothetical protein
MTRAMDSTKFNNFFFNFIFNRNIKLKKKQHKKKNKEKSLDVWVYSPTCLILCKEEPKCVGFQTQALDFILFFYLTRVYDRLLT